MLLKRFIEEESSEKFDLIIVGGGITGAAVAYIAAARSLSVALFEKKDYGGATSAATSKAHPRRPAVPGQRRAEACARIPARAQDPRQHSPEFCLLPALPYADVQKVEGQHLEDAGRHVLYDALSYDKKDTWDKSKRLQNHKLISHRKTIRLEPNLKMEDLRNAFYFFDYQSIFPERLTLAFIKSAAEYGARVSNYTPVEGFVFGDGNRITGVRVRDTFTGRTKEVHGDLIINCGGTWADKILNLAAGRVSVSP